MKKCTIKILVLLLITSMGANVLSHEATINYQAQL